VADASAGGTRRFIGYGLFPEWSPTGDSIVYQRARERGTQWFSIWTLTMVDGEPRYPTEVAASATQAMILPTWSPDGRRIAFAATSRDGGAGAPLGDGADSGTFDIWIMQADGSGKSRLTDGHTFNASPAFSPDGRIFFTSNRSGHENIWSLIPGNGLNGWTAGSATTDVSIVPSGSAVPASMKNGL
jgi:TolB protein